MYSSFCLVISLLSLCNASFHVHNASPLITRQDVSNSSAITNITIRDCEDVLDFGLNATCWDTLNMTSYMNSWNLTNEANNTCATNELWANCFMRVAGLTVPKGLGCAQVGPNTCPEPTADDLSLNDAETAYGIYSIWALQNLYTAIYNDLSGDGGQALIQSAWNNLTTAQQSNQDGKSLLGAILFSTPDPRSQFLGLQVISSVPMPFTNDISIPRVGGAQKVLGDVIATYLESAMTNYTLGGFWGIAKGGKLI